RHVRLAKGGRAGGACVGDVDDGDSGLAYLLQDSLPDHRVGLVEISAGEHLDVLDSDSGVLEREDRRLAAEFRNGLVGIASEFDHPGSENINISHLDSSWRPGPKLRSVVMLFAALAGRPSSCSAGTK